MQLHEPIKQILKDTRPIWNRDSTRPYVRESFRKMIECRTPVLGWLLYASETEVRRVYFTCKVRSGSVRQQHRKAVASELDFSSCCRRALDMPSIQSPASTSLGGSLQPLADRNGRASQPFVLPSPLVLARPGSRSRSRPHPRRVVSSRPHLSQPAPERWQQRAQLVPHPMRP